MFHVEHKIFCSYEQVKEFLLIVINSVIPTQ